MATTTIQISVPPDIAEAFRTAPAPERAKLNLLLALWFREMADRSIPLGTVMTKMSETAQSRGLTAQKLRRMLRER